MEVPERILKFIFPTAGDHAARIFNPGAATSGCKIGNTIYFILQYVGKRETSHKCQINHLSTFKISGVKALGPFEENDATLGAG